MPGTMSARAQREEHPEAKAPGHPDQLSLHFPLDQGVFGADDEVIPVGGYQWR